MAKIALNLVIGQSKEKWHTQKQDTPPLKSINMKNNLRNKDSVSRWNMQAFREKTAETISQRSQPPKESLIYYFMLTHY